jgi:hypothetical protein
LVSIAEPCGFQLSFCSRNHWTRTGRPDTASLRHPAAESTRAASSDDAVHRGPAGCDLKSESLA